MTMKTMDLYAAKGFTSKIVSVDIKGNKYWKEQWYYKGQSIDYRREESTSECLARNNIKEE